MLITHTFDRGTLKVKIHSDLDITNRAAAALRIEALVAAHRPDQVLFELPTDEPSPATLSSIARAHRMCRSLSVAFTLTGTHVQLLESPDSPPARLDSGARRHR
ncbi:hypothetical protein [Streptomyces sp. A1547]|uniref:hypothetical protein n=1 Tax=Streptomyces sp. A1547 TaxID=2563105 RepID=UPI0019D2FB85|nr:hypothetical protein [Streptomyces sp. A1547]